jgi:hypothetical protein
MATDMSMLPKEHGAYGQLAFPIVTALAVAGVTPAALLTAVASIAGFLTHEPLLVVLGRRGARAKREQATRAQKWLAVSASIALSAGVAAVWLTSSYHRWSFLLPLLPLALLAVLVGTEREKTAIGESAAALAFSCVAIPMCLAAGATIPTALSVGIAFASLFVASTLAVRVIVLEVRGGGDPPLVRATRAVVLVLAASIAASLMVATSHGLLPSIVLAAVAPGLSISGWLALRPPAAARLRIVGWTLVSASAVTAVILITGLRHTG